MFSMLNPQPNGAGFVGFYIDDPWDLSTFSGLKLKVRGQGDNTVYKLNLRHNGQGTNEVAYETFYEVSNVYTYWEYHHIFFKRMITAE